MAINLTAVNTIATKRIMPGVVDGFFKSGPLMRMLRARFSQRWAGPLIQENFLYAPMRVVAYKKGATFNTDPRQTFAGTQFSPRYKEANNTEDLEDLEVEMTGPTAAFSKLKVDMWNAATSLSASLEIDAFHNGQNLGAGPLDRSAYINGLEEALTNGTQATYTGATFPSYGGQTRADVGDALITPTGYISSPSVASTSFRVFEHSYESCVIGEEHPQLGLTTNRMRGFIAETFLAQKKIDTTAPEINWPGMKFNQSTIVASQYCPGQDGKNDPDIGNYLNDSETFWWLNFGPQGDDAYIRLYLAASELFAFGFTGFKGARGDTVVSGQILFGGNLSVRGGAIRFMRALYGFVK
jgi:hypothetical protein